MINLDHNATTPIDPLVLESIVSCMHEHGANPASQHESGQRARRRLRDAMDAIGHFLGADPTDQLVLTSGGTEANNLALRGLVGPPPAKIVVSSVEHPSVAKTAEYLESTGYTVCRLPVDSSGVVRLDRLEEYLTDDVRLVSVMLANHETGAIQPIGPIVEWAAARGILVHTDAVQMVGKGPVHFRTLGVAAMTVAPHKFHGPLGIGALVVQRNVPLRPILYGGTQQLGVRPGTESVALAVGFAKALQQSVGRVSAYGRDVANIRDNFEAAVRQSIPQVISVSANVPRIPNTSCLAFPGWDRQLAFLRLDRAGVGCSTGSACASGSTEPSPVLLAMGCPADVVSSALRFSLGMTTSEQEVRSAAEIIGRTLSRPAA